MASATDNHSIANQMMVRRTSRIKRTTTMDTMTTLTSTSTSSFRASFRGPRRTENLMKLISGETLRNSNSSQSPAVNSINRVRMSNNFAKEHYYSVEKRKTEHKFRPVRHSSLSSDIGAANSQLESSSVRNSGMLLSRHESLNFLKQDKRGSFLRRYSFLTNNSQKSRLPRRSSYVLKKSTSFLSMSNASGVLLSLLPPPEPKAIEKFRHYVRILRIVIRAVTRAKDSAKNTFASITSTNDMTVSCDCVHNPLALAKATSVKNSGLVFDASIFKANKEQQIPSEVKRILSSPPEERQEASIHKALLNLRNAVDAFCEFPLMMQKSLVKIGWYESFEAKRVIIRQGYPAERYYFIVSGSAMVSVISEDRTTKKFQIQPKAILRKGNSFGENALMQNGLRDSTVIAETEMEVLMIEKDDFMKIYLPDPQGMEPDLVHFLRSVECFSQWPVHLLRYDDPNHCLQIYFRRGSVVCKDAAHSDWIYIVKTGSCRVVKKLRVSTSTYSGINRPCQYSFETKERNGRCRRPSCNTTSLSKKCNSSQRTDWWNDPAVLSTKNRSDGNPSMESTEGNDDLHRHVYMQIQQLGEGDVFGVLPIVFPHEDDVTCGVTLISDGAECVMIARRLYIQHLTEKFTRFLQNKLRPWPTGHNLQQQLRDTSNWQQFKCNIMYKALESCSKLSLKALP